jgi:hypothetical protein
MVVGMISTRVWRQHSMAAEYEKYMMVEYDHCMVVKMVIELTGQSMVRMYNLNMIPNGTSMLK